MASAQSPLGPGEEDLRRSLVADAPDYIPSYRRARGTRSGDRTHSSTSPSLVSSKILDIAFADHCRTNDRNAVVKEKRMPPTPPLLLLRHTLRQPGQRSFLTAGTGARLPVIGRTPRTAALSFLMGLGSPACLEVICIVASILILRMVFTRVTDTVLYPTRSVHAKAGLSSPPNDGEAVTCSAGSGRGIVNMSELPWTESARSSVDATLRANQPSNMRRACLLGIAATTLLGHPRRRSARTAGSTHPDQLCRRITPTPLRLSPSRPTLVAIHVHRTLHGSRRSPGW